MRIADFGLRIAPSGRRILRPAPSIGPSPANPQSAIHNPQWFARAILLALLSTACRGDGRTPLIVYSPHGRDLLTLLERRFEQLHPDVDVRRSEEHTSELQSQSN